MAESLAAETAAKTIWTLEPKTRSLVIPLDQRVLGVESDDAAVRKFFDFPRFVGDGIDLADLSIRINYQNAGGFTGQDLCDEVEISQDRITFSWLVKRPVTAYRGTVRVVVCAVKVDDARQILTEWNTAPASLQVLQGVEPGTPADTSPEMDWLALLDSKVSREGWTANRYLGTDAWGRVVTRDGVHMTPLFANSLAECTDPTKLYVLPDGYLYAYMETTVTQTHTNQLDVVGFQSGYRLSSSGAESALSGSYLTGYIPCKPGDVIRLKNVTFQTNVTTGLTSSNQRLAGYTADHTLVKVNNVNDIGLTNPEEWAVVLDENGVVTQFTLRADTYANTEYIRINGSYLGEDSIITVNEPMEKSTTVVTAWTNTGHAFVPADYEDRILDLEQIAAAQDTRLTDLEAEADAAVSTVRQEANRVADLVFAKRNAQCLCFAALGDVHYPVGGEATRQALLHTGMGIREIRRLLPLDFVGLFGDYVAGGSDATLAESREAMKLVHQSLYEAGMGVQQIWMQGNHDWNPYDTDDGNLTDEELYSYIFANNLGTVVDETAVQRGYGYLDFDKQKVRVIYWNTSDISGAETPTEHRISAEQYQWMAAHALDFSGKEKPGEWGIVMLLHMPVNWSAQLTAFVDAYLAGTSATITAAEATPVTVDFTGKNQAELICTINGHTHNYRASRVGTNSFWQIAVPQVCAGRYNEYGTTWPEVGGELDESGAPIYHYKTPDTAESTSFCVFLIDRKNRKIHAIHYGAGIDRELSY